MNKPEPGNAFEGYMIAKIDNIDRVLSDHNAQTAEISSDVADLKKSKYIVYGAISLLTFVGTVAGIVSLFM